MNKKVLLIILLLSNVILGNEINQSSTSTAESKSKACTQALLQAQKEALHQSGINIFTSYKSNTTVTDNEVKKIIDNSLQSSYGSITTLSKKEKVTFDNTTGYITCKVDGVFEVDTTKLKSQMLALSKKYDNQYKEENSKEEALNKKNNLMQKYDTLKTNVTKTHTFNYNDKYECSEDISLKTCKNQFNDKIELFFQDKLSEQYKINSKLLTFDAVSKKNKFKTKYNSNIILLYNGKITGKAISIENPYLDEINSLNTFLGNEKFIKKSNENTNSLNVNHIIIKKNYLSKKDKESLINNNTLIKLNARISSSFMALFFIPLRYETDVFKGKVNVLNMQTQKLLEKYNGDFLLNVRFEDLIQHNLSLQGQGYTLIADVYKKGKINDKNK